MIVEPVFQAFDKCPLVPVLTIDDATNAGELARALIAAGLTAAEVTLRTPSALSAITKMKTEVPQLKVGAGTIISKPDIDDAIAAGSDFLVTPATPRPLANYLENLPVPVFPGVATPTEALAMYDRGFECLKFFPAESNGGIAALKSIAGPLPDIKFMPTGGITAETYKDYLALKTVVAIGGSFMIDRNALMSEDWVAITKVAKKYCDRVKKT